MIDKILEFDRQSLDDPLLNEDKIFIKLRECLRKFTVHADESIKSMTTHLIPDYKFQIKLHDSLRNILREIVNADKKIKDDFLLRTYKWYFGKLGACGAMNEEMKESED